MKCWNCSAPLEEIDPRHLAFRATCDTCHAWLHCCKNCKYYQLGQPNDCAIPDTDPISDREACNFCDEFRFAEDPKQTHSQANEATKKVFGLSEIPDAAKGAKERFMDLFDSDRE